MSPSSEFLSLSLCFFFNFRFLLNWTLKGANTEHCIYYYNLNFDTLYPTVALSFLRIGNYQEILDEIMKNHSENNETKQAILNLSV